MHSWAVVAHAFNPSTWEAEAGLVYKGSSRTARAVQRDPVSNPLPPPKKKKSNPKQCIRPCASQVLGMGIWSLVDVPSDTLKDFE